MHRPLPWRETNDPYRIWISEIILQQTRVGQGYDYYRRFIDKYPDIIALSKAQEEDVLKLWQGLGYYSRARNLLKTAKNIVNDYNGIFPDTYNEVISLKGIGPYTAAAILSIAFNKPYSVIDGNVLRVMARYLAIKKPVADVSAKKEIASYLSSQIDKKKPGTFNQAIMEIGALVCKPGKPSCEKCPLSRDCKAYKLKKTSEFPVPGRKTAVVKRYFYYLVIRVRHKKGIYLYINKRTGTDIWKNLYDFPSLETSKQQSTLQLTKSKGWNDLFKGVNPKVVSVSEQILHRLTHRELIVRFIEVKITTGLKCKNNFLLIGSEKIHLYPVPRLIEKYLENNPVKD